MAPTPIEATELVLKVDWRWLLAVIGALGALLWRAAERFSRVETSVDWIKDEMRRVWSKLDAKESGLVATNSPVTITEKGHRVLERSGLKTYIDQNQENLFVNCNTEKEMKTAYDVQDATMKCFSKLELSSDLLDKVKQAAFDDGTSIGAVKQVGALYLRDLIIKKLNLKIEDLDQ